MSEALATLLVRSSGLYLAAGVWVAAWLVRRGLSRLDPRAEGGSWGFRLVVLPGLVALWPLLLMRALRGTPLPEERTAHRGGAR